MRILEIGPGTADGKSVVFPGADTVDMLGEPTYTAEWGRGTLPIPDMTYDLVFASHVLEHIPWYRAATALRDVRRVLKKHGQFEIYVPDFDYIVSCYREKRCGDSWRVFNDAGDWMTWVNGRIFTYGPDATELKSKVRPIPQTHHKAVYTTPYLMQRLREAEFEQMNAVSTRRYGHAHSIREIGIIAVRT